jgi:uncharacterized Zn-binding protein involved in type VI secretion
MPSVAIHPPKTPATKGSHGIAKATLPNVCKMPGPPAPFVPSPLPNIAKSGMSPKGYSKKVKIEGNSVAIRGATFKSMGDVASKGTGGGLISANTHGPAKFITLGSLTVKIEGKSVHLLGEPMLNNCGASGTPPNTGATMLGMDQGDLDPADCPGHDLKWEELTPEGEQARSDRKNQEKTKREQDMRKHQYDYEHGTGGGNADNSFNLWREQVLAQEKADFAQRVAEKAKAKWTEVKYWCTKCTFSGDIDVITEDGVIKECKGNGKLSRDQYDKYQIMGPAMLGAAFKGVHFAVPGNMMQNAQNSRAGLELGDTTIQPH